MLEVFLYLLVGFVVGYCTRESILLDRNFWRSYAQSLEKIIQSYGKSIRRSVKRQ